MARSDMAQARMGVLIAATHHQIGVVGRTGKIDMCIYLFSV